jgi:hypothetical protein
MGGLYGSPRWLWPWPSSNALNAFANDRLVTDVAKDVVARRISLQRNPAWLSHSGCGEL